MQNRGVRTWEEFLEAVRSEDMTSRPGRNFWSNQRISEIAATWSEAVGRDHFTLITIPPRGAPPEVLWERFSEVAGIPRGLCDLDVRSNPALDAASALVLRSVNERLTEHGFDRQEYERVVKGMLAKQGLVRRGRETVPLGIDERWVRRKSRDEVDRLRALDLRVVGDLDELAADKVPGVHTRKVTAEQQLEAAVDGLVFLLERLMKPRPTPRVRPDPPTERTTSEPRARPPARPGRPARRRPGLPGRGGPGVAGARALRARAGGAAADRRDHVLPRRGPDAAPVGALLRRPVRRRQHLRRRRQLRGRLHRRPALRRPARAPDPGWQVQQHPDGHGRQPRPLAAHAVRRRALLRHRRVPRPRPGEVRRPQGLRRGQGRRGPRRRRLAGLQRGARRRQRAPARPHPAAARAAPPGQVPAPDVQARHQVGPGPLERRHPRHPHAVRRGPRPVDVPHEVRRPRPPAGGRRPPPAHGRGRRPLPRHPVAPGRRHPRRPPRHGHHAVSTPRPSPSSCPRPARSWPPWSSRTRPATGAPPRAAR